MRWERNLRYEELHLYCHMTSCYNLSQLVDDQCHKYSKFEGTRCLDFQRVLSMVLIIIYKEFRLISFSKGHVIGNHEVLLYNNSIIKKLMFSVMIIAQGAYNH